MLEYLFDTTFIIALNTLAGDRISGMGLKNLRNCAQDGPAVIFAPEGIYISYQWVSGGNVASDKLLKQMQSIEKPLVCFCPDCETAKAYDEIGRNRSSSHQI